MGKNNDDFYKQKREWSKIKDSLLRTYLAPYFQKLLWSNNPICYVDCFAGRGDFDDGSEGSPLIALNVRDDALSKTRNTGNKGIEMFFIETKYAAQLTQKVENYKVNGVANVIEGRFEDKIVDLLKDKNGYNVFLYIDPYGIRSLDFSIFKQLNKYNFNTFEMLINFNSFGFFRAACSAMKIDVGNEEAFQDFDEFDEDEFLTAYTPSKQKMLLNSVANGVYWQDIVREYNDVRDGYKAEEILSENYKQQLKQYYKYVLDLPIRLKPDQRPKYRMVHVCNHADGCYLMSENMIKRNEELVFYIQQDRQYVLFPDKSAVDGKSFTDEEIKEMVRSSVNATTDSIHIREFLANFVSRNGIVCEFDKIYPMLEEMRSAGSISIIREPAYTPTGRKSTFWDEDNNHKVILKKC